MRLGYLQLFAFAMRYHQNLPKAPVKKNLKTIPRVKADREVLQRFAALAEQLGFNSPEIEELKNLDPGPIPDTQQLVPLLVTTGPGEVIKHRCGLPHTDTFEADRKYLFLHNLCEERDETGEGITSFFILKSWFTAFFDPPRLTRPDLSTECPNPLLPLAHHQHVDEDDMDMQDTNQREQEEQPIIQVQNRMDTDEQRQETIESVQQRISRPAIEANRMPEEEQETLFGNILIRDVFISLIGNSLVPRELTTQSQATEAGNTVIRFVERGGNESDMLKPLQEYVGKLLELRVDHGDPTSLVEEQVQNFYAWVRELAIDIRRTFLQKSVTA
jgi:hypothetical protein